MRQDIDKAAEDFTEIVKTAFNTNIPRKKIRVRQDDGVRVTKLKPGDTKAAIKERKKLAKKRSKRAQKPISYNKTLVIKKI